MLEFKDPSKVEHLIRYKIDENNTIEMLLNNSGDTIEAIHLLTKSKEGNGICNNTFLELKDIGTNKIKYLCAWQNKDYFNDLLSTTDKIIKDKHYLITTYMQKKDKPLRFEDYVAKKYQEFDND